MELGQTLRFKFAIELLDKTLHGRTLELQPQVANGPAQEFLVQRFRFSVVFIVHKRSLTNSLQPRGHTRGEAVSL